MARQQSRRRRKRYQPGSAYAGDVKPAGVIGFLGSPSTMRIVFLVMALALAAGGAGALFASNILTRGTGNDQQDDFVRPTDDGATGAPTGQATLEIKRYTSAPPLTIDPSKRYTATINTSAGEIKIDLFADQVPQTVNNFVFLARDGFYDGLTFHQVAEGFAAQAGDPGCQEGRTEASTCRGSGDPGYQLPQEKPGAFQPGFLGMANASQFFIAFRDAPQFAEYTPLGRITSGLDVAQQITLGTTIESITIAEQ